MEKARVCGTCVQHRHSEILQKSKLWIHLNTTGTKRKKQGWRQTQKCKRKWGRWLVWTLTVFHLLFLGSQSDIDLAPVVSQVWEAKWKWSTQIREERENEVIHSRHQKRHQERMHLAKTLLWPCQNSALTLPRTLESSTENNRRWWTSSFRTSLEASVTD